MDIDVSLAEVDQEIISNKKKMTLFAVVAILGISLTIGLFVQRFVSQPVKHLLEGTERVSAGDLSTPLDISSTNEIGTLARSFDQMTQLLQISEQELKASEEKYRSLFDNDPNPILVFDRATFQIIDANIRATEKYGYSGEELLQLSFRDLGDPEDEEKIRSLVVEACVFSAQDQASQKGWKHHARGHPFMPPGASGRRCHYCQYCRHHRQYSGRGSTDPGQQDGHPGRDVCRDGP